MTKAKKSILTVVLALLSAMFILMSVGMNAKPTYAEELTPLQQVTSLKMEGVEIRVDGKGNGMKFVGSFDAEDYTNKLSGYDKVEYGVFIMPEYYLELVGKTEIDQGSTFGTEDENPVFIWGDEITEPVVDGKYTIIQMDSLAVQDGDKMVICGSVVA